MKQMPVIHIPKLLRDRLGEEGADSLAELLNQVVCKQEQFFALSYERRLTDEAARINQRITDETAKLDKRITEETGKLDKRITEETGKLDKRIAEETGKLDKRIAEETARLDRRITEEIAALDRRIANTTSAVVKWMFVFWVGQLAAVAGVLAVMLR